MNDDHDYEDHSFWDGYACGRNKILEELHLVPDKQSGFVSCYCGRKIIGVYEKSNDSWVAGCKSCQIFLFEDTKEALRKKWNSIRGVPQS